MRRFNLKTIVVILLVSVVFYSCDEKTRYQSVLMLRNETEGTLNVKLYPKAKFLKGDYYRSATNSGGYNSTTFEIGSGMDENIYYTDDMQIECWELLAAVFDSIHIETSGENHKLLRFLPAQVQGYSENMYNESASWVFEVNRFDMPTQFRQNPVESHDHIFVISGDNN